MRRLRGIAWLNLFGNNDIIVIRGVAYGSPFVL